MAKRKKTRMDGYINTVVGHGDRRRDPYESYRFQGYQMSDSACDSMFTYNAIAQKIIKSPADEAVRTGFTLKNGDAVIPETSALLSALETLRWQEMFSTAVCWDRLYGGALMVLILDDGSTDLTLPVNENSIRGIESIAVYDKRSVAFRSTYQDGPKTGEPEVYTVMNSYGGSFDIHESRCLRFTGGLISDWKRRQRDGWGGKVLEQMREEMGNYKNSMSRALQILSRMSQGILKLDGLSSLLQSDAGEMVVRRRLQTIDMARDLLNTIAIDSEDEYDVKNLSLAGIKDLVEEFEVSLSAASGIPMTVLFGRSPAGLNSTGKSDLENYYNMVERIRQRTIRPHLQHLIDIMDRGGQVKLPQQYTLVFDPLWNPTEKEMAETRQLKADALSKMSAGCSALYQMGAIDPGEVRAQLAASGEWKLKEPEA